MQENFYLINDEKLDSYEVTIISQTSLVTISLLWWCFNCTLMSHHFSNLVAFYASVSICVCLMKI